MTRAKYVASFLGREPGRALFVGLYEIGASRPLTFEQYWKVPAYTEMKEFGMIGFRPEKGGGQENAWQYVWMPKTNSDGVQYVARFTDIMDDQGGSIVDFFMMLFDTARNWGDTKLMAMPGYRDRIVHVGLSKEEGLLDLNMPQETIKSIGERGELAGTLLTERFSLKRPHDRLTGKVIQLTWDNHRWVRYRAIMAAIEDLARRFQNRWDIVARKGQPRSYPQLLKRSPSSKPRSYPFGDQDHRRFAEEVTAEFISFVKNGFDAKRSFDLGDSDRQGRSPRPKPRLRVMPPGSSDPREERF